MKRKWSFSIPLAAEPSHITIDRVQVLSITWSNRAGKDGGALEVQEISRLEIQR